MKTRSKILGVISATIILVSFQNCGQVDIGGDEGAIDLSSVSELTALTAEPSVSLVKTSNNLASSASLFSALNLAPSDSLNRINKDKGFDLVVEDGNEWVKCGFDPGGGNGDLIGATVISFNCDLSHEVFQKSSSSISVSYNLYHAMKQLHEDQTNLSTNHRTVSYSASTYTIADIDGEFSCIDTSGLYECGYTAN